MQFNEGRTSHSLVFLGLLIVYCSPDCKGGDREGECISAED